MSEYKVIARKFRPQFFKEVVGQDSIVVTLKNAIKLKRVAQAYLFCGSRGTGKTTLARIFAKALNCLNPTSDFEPCNECSSCREITNGSSLDILEIDGASNRGIEDIRQINENVGYTASSGGYKIYIIDEVHMLTKEAFNALLKTLEEPPAKVKFFFATTEPHKILPTILSRCQRFNLNRIPTEKIVAKLHHIADRLGVEAEPEALQIIARQAEGGLRDAESLFDQILAYEDKKVTASAVNSVLGLVSKDVYFELDHAAKEGNIAKAFEVAHDIFSQGKDLMHFVDGLIEHFRTIILIKISTKESPLLELQTCEREKYEAASLLYSQEQCLSLIDYLVQEQNRLRFASSGRIALESILLYTLRSRYRIPVDVLVRRLSELEQAIAESSSDEHKNPSPTPTDHFSPKQEKQPVKEENSAEPVPAKTPPAPAFTIAELPRASSVSIDPTPSLADFGKKAPAILERKEPAKKKTDKYSAEIQEPATTPPQEKISQEKNQSAKPAHYYDTLLHFAAVELEGKIRKL